jgi:hypothetical protein
MNKKENFSGMVAYDFSNLDVQQEGNDNCYCDDGGNCNGCDRVSCDNNFSNCDNCNCDHFDGCDQGCDHCQVK